MNERKIISTQELMTDVEYRSGKSLGWPEAIKYGIHRDSVSISADSRALDKKTARRLDPWGLAFLVEAEHRCGIRATSISFTLSGEASETERDSRLPPNLEAFRRRVSFLSINNPDLRFRITINGERIDLDDSSTLFNRPQNETIHERFGSRRDNKPGRLEKDFQTWLYANDIKDARERDATTNVRLAVLGGDFFKLGNKRFGIIREFPTGVFDRNISQKPTQRSRVLPTEFVDIVTFNKYGQLALVELKLNDSQLEVIAQLVDYSLFFRCYRDLLRPVIAEKLVRDPRGKHIVCYVVNNCFHRRFNDVIRYYTPKDDSHGFRIVKTLLGHYTDAESHAASV